MIPTNGRTLPDLPEFLRRDANTQESEPMKVSSPLKANDETAPQATPKPRKALAKPARAHKASNGNGKAPKVTKATRAARTVDPAKLDRFGFRKGSLKSQAAAMYSSRKGATLAEVKEALESTQFNLLTELEAAGFEIEKTPIKGNGPRKITRYRVIPK